MQFAILRTQKLKHLASVRRSLGHSFRAQDTPNADPARAGDNEHIGAGNLAEAMTKVEARLPEKRRKDAVLVIEYLVTASPETMAGKSRAEQDAYLREALNWIRARHGAENVVYAGIHRDETTPHLYAYAVPLDPATGRLNAKKWLGGAKALAQMQTQFADQVGLRHGLERGTEGSKATHQRVKRFYGAVKAAQAEVNMVAQAVPPLPTPPALGRASWAEAQTQLTRAAVSRALAPVAARAATADAGVSQAKARAQEAEERARRAEEAAQAAVQVAQARLAEAMRERDEARAERDQARAEVGRLKSRIEKLRNTLKAWLDAFKTGLTEVQQRALVRQADDWRRENEKAAQKAQEEAQKPAPQQPQELDDDESDGLTMGW